MRLLKDNIQECDLWHILDQFYPLHIRKIKISIWTNHRNSQIWFMNRGIPWFRRRISETIVETNPETSTDINSQQTDVLYSQQEQCQQIVMPVLHVQQARRCSKKYCQ